jgi:predicted Zn-dependent protease
MSDNNIHIQFSQIDKFDSNNDINKFYICFNYVSIDGEYLICGNTYLSSILNTINIDIDKDENYSIQGLFEIIVKHELGHAFGLAHSSYPKSIMYPFVNQLDKSVSVYDIKKIIQ